MSAEKLKNNVKPRPAKPSPKKSNNSYSPKPIPKHSVPPQKTTQPKKSKT